MINYLIICFIIIIIQIIGLGIIVSYLEFEVEEIDVSYNKESYKRININKLKVNVKLYWFRKVKIFKIKIYKNYCEIFKIKIHLDLLKRMKDNKEYGIWFVLRNIKKLKPEIKSVNMELVGGTEDLFLTTFLIPTFSTVLFSFISKNMKNVKELENYNFKIVPTYINTNNFSIKGKTQIYFDTMRTLFFIKKHKEIKN